MRLDLPPTGELQVSFIFHTYTSSSIFLSIFELVYHSFSRFWTWDGAEQCFLKAKYLTTVPVDNHTSGTKDCSMGEN